MSHPTTRELDVVVFGATGFTGQLVAKYLVTRAPQLRVGLGGRSRARLEAVRSALPGRPELPLLEADSFDRPALERMAARTRVVLTTVGPYVRFGEPLVEACLAARTDYLDLTGEPAFWTRLIDQHHAEARARGVILVPGAGFDCVPADLGTMLAVEALGPTGDKQADGFLVARGSASGGTWQSALGILADFDRRHVHHRPHLVPRYEPLVERWVMELPLLDTLVVQRSASFDARYGRSFRYGHHYASRSLARLGGLALGLPGALALARIPPARRALEALRPAGAGPSEEARARAFFRLTVRARAGEREAVAIVAGGDPGYDETAKIVAEAARCLVEHRGELPHAGGVLSPAIAFGPQLVTRLRAAGLRLELVSAP